MTRPILKWVFPTCLVLCLTVLMSQARAQQAPKAFPNISPTQGLKTNAPIAMPTIWRKGQPIPANASASPFSGAASPNASASHVLRYPGDLQYHGGPVVTYATHHSLFVNPTTACPPNSCWGDPIGFLNDFGRSDMIHVTDQYVGAHQDNRYIGGANYYFPSYTPSAGAGKPFTDLDLAIAAYSVAAATGGFGLNNIYHLFLVPGQDTCFDDTFTACYSPDNNSTFYFCAYHGGVQDAAGNVVLYTVEPYQNVNGCSVGPGTPNGPLADSTDNVLSHEVIETITDPAGTAWWNQLNAVLYGEEIADECAFVLFTPTNEYWDPSVVRLNRKAYAIQPEYNNLQHACTTKP